MAYHNLAHTIEEFAKITPGQIAIIDDSRQITYKELAETTARISAYLQQKKIKCLAVHLPNSAELIYIYLACFKAGVITIPLSIMMKKPEIEFVLNNTNPDLVITHSQYAEEIKYLHPGAGLIMAGNTHDGITFTTLLNHTFTSTQQWPEITSPAAIFYTSGSTGNPKGVVHSHYSLSAIAAVMGECFDITTQERFLVSEAMTNASGCSHAMLTLQHGATVIVMNGFQIDDFISQLRSCKPNLLCIMGKGNYDIVNSSAISADDFRCVRVNITGGDKVTPELIQEFHRKTSVPLRLSYGMSEILVITMNKSDAPEKCGSIGTAMQQVDIQLRDKQGNMVANGSTGEAWVKGPNMLTSYWHDQKETHKALVDGWLRTGDILRCDDDGFYWFYGRSKHIIVRQGDNISPLEVEKALMRHPAVLDAGVTGMPSREEGQVPVAYVELRHNQQASPAALLEFLKTQLESYKIPTGITIIATLPRTKSGKIDREKLKHINTNGH